MIESASGLILRRRPLTPDFGRIATVAKGARRPKSRFAGKLDLFYFADLSFQHSRRSELLALREVSLREACGASRIANTRLQGDWLALSRLQLS